MLSYLGQWKRCLSPRTRRWRTPARQRGWGTWTQLRCPASSVGLPPAQCRAPWKLHRHTNDETMTSSAMCSPHHFIVELFLPEAIHLVFLFQMIKEVKFDIIHLHRTCSGIYDEWCVDNGWTSRLSHHNVDKNYNLLLFTSSAFHQLPQLSTCIHWKLLLVYCLNSSNPACALAINGASSH